MLVSQFIKNLRTQNPSFQPYFSKMSQQQVIRNLIEIIKEAIQQKTLNYINTSVDIRVTQPPNMKRSSTMKRSSQITEKITSINQSAILPHKIMGKPRIQVQPLNEDQINDYKSFRNINPNKSKNMINLTDSNVSHNTQEQKANNIKKSVINIKTQSNIQYNIQEQKENNNIRKPIINLKKQPNIQTNVHEQKESNNKMRKSTANMQTQIITSNNKKQINKDKDNKFNENIQYQHNKQKNKKFAILSLFSVDFIPMSPVKQQIKNKQVGKIIATKNVNSSKSPQNHHDYFLKQQRNKNLKENNDKLAKICQQQMKIISHLQLQQRRSQLSTTMPKGMLKGQSSKINSKALNKHHTITDDLDCSCCSSNQSELFEKIIREKHRLTSTNFHKNNLKTYKINDNPTYLLTSSEQTPRNYLH